MKDYNKINLQNWCVVALAALTAVFTVVAGCYVKEAHGLWSIPLPVLGVGYGIYAFVKKYIKPLPKPEDVSKK